MLRSAAVAAVLLLALAAAAGGQRPRCRRQDGGTVCTTNSSRLFILKGTATWPEAHELCRRRDMFLLDEGLILLSNSIHQQNSTIIWMGAKYLRNGYTQWTLPLPNRTRTPRCPVTTLVSNPSGLCLALTGFKTHWESCQSRHSVVCLFDERTVAETAPARYSPSLSVHVAGVLLKQTAEDVVLTVRPSQLSKFDLVIRCGDGDTIVKDHFVLGRTEYRSSWWADNFTIVKQLLPPVEAAPLDVGTFWCQRYVEGAVDPVISSRLHVTTSKDMMVLRGSQTNVLNTFLEMFSTEDEGFRRRQIVEHQGNVPVNFETRLLRLVNAADIRAKLSYLALYEFPVEGAEVQQPPQAPSKGGNKTMSSALDSKEYSVTLLFTVLGDVRKLDVPTSASGAFVCPETDVGGHVWRSRNTTDFAASEPECVVAGGAARVERRCVPSFERGAAWGPFCAAGRCQPDLPQCRTPRPVCPAGFQPTRSKTMCALLLDGVTYEERSAACRRRHRRAFAWNDDTNPFGITYPLFGNRTAWLSSRRLWRNGPFWPLLEAVAIKYWPLSVSRFLSWRDGGACVVLELVSSVHILRSVPCSERHAVLCFLRPDDEPPVHASSSCGTLPNSVRSEAEPARCFSLLCSRRALPWPAAAAQCAQHGASLASLSSWWSSAAALQVAAASELEHRIAAVDLERRGNEVRWGDGAPLTYPALAPDLSAAREHTRGVLRLSTGQYQFVGEREHIARCAVCEQTLSTAVPELHLFHGEWFGQPAIFLNVTVPFAASAQDRVRIRDRVRCFTSTSQHPDLGYRVNRLIDVDAKNKTLAFFWRILSQVSFGILRCALYAQRFPGNIVSNGLVLREHESSDRRRHVQEYVVGLQSQTSGNRADEARNAVCQATFCMGKCRCFGQRFETQIINGNHSAYALRLWPIRIKKSDDGHLIEFYLATVNQTSPPRRLHRVASEATDGAQLLRRQFGSALEYLRPARCCQPERTERPAPLSWPRTCGGAAVPTELCLDAAGRPALRRCTGDPLSGVRWGPVELAGEACAAVPSRTTLDLHRLANTPVTAATSANMTAELVHLTSRPAELVAQDVISATMTLENVERALRRQPAPTAAEAHAVRRHAVAAVSHLADVDGSSLEAASESVSSGPRAVRALERIVASTPAQDNAEVTSDNVAVRSGRLFGAISASSNVREGSVRLVNTSAGRSMLFGVEAALLLADGQPADGGLFLVLRDGRLLHSADQRVTSQVLSLLVPDRPGQENVRRRVLLAFRSSGRQCAPAPTCAFWDWDAAAWSTRGCWLQEVANGSDVCVCNHLTNFARIFNYEPDVYLSEWHHRLLDVITYVGCALSLLGLVLTVATFVLFKKWRQPRGNQIVLQLSVALLGVYVSFLGGLAATEHHAACVSMSALLHYFLLAAFAWMAVEAVHQYLRFVRVLGTYVPGFMRKASVFAWGSALVPVVALLSTRHDCYDAQPHVCWMDFDSFYYAFALPVLAVMAFNVIVFGLVVRSLTCGGRQKLRTNQSERRLALLRLRMAAVTFVLLGVPWLFGFLAVRQARLVFAVLFCVCNMLQGAAIFVLMVAGEGGARQLWRGLVAGQCCATGDANSSASSGPATTSSADVRSRAAPRRQESCL